MFYYALPLHLKQITKIMSPSTAQTDHDRGNSSIVLFPVFHEDKCDIFFVRKRRFVVVVLFRHYGKSNPT